MTDLHIELIERLDVAAAALREALDVISDRYGSSDELFDALVEAASTAETASTRLQNDADTYGEIAHFGA